ncbi:MAG: outer membrane beta-barrel protein, partial [Bacteroidales bacterium]|nr:outer membrane beta-barrel protein [Bacteroidales bacterium]
DNTGVGEWNWFVSPDISFQHTVGTNRFFATASGSNQRPGNVSMIPTMNIIDPARPTLGNIYLKPYGNTYLSLSWNRNNREKFSTLMAYLFGNFNTNPISYARWYDSDGILYSIPVNSKKSTMSLSGVITYTTPLDAKKKWFLTSDVGLGFSASTSYQAKGTLEGLDKDSFDYSSFMDSFWGGKDGDIFYSGKSGFEESTTRNFTPDLSLSLKYTSGSFSGRVESDFSSRIARYSLDDRVNMNTLDSRIGAGANYRTKHEFEFDTDIAYAWYRGYAKGYGAPEWQWNGEISKNIKAFNLSIKINDILNQTRNLTHTVTANYEEDTYRLVMGRYILFGVKWNFGKMNAAHSQRAQRAAINMVF